MSHHRSLLVTIVWIAFIAYSLVAWILLISSVGRFAS